MSKAFRLALFGALLSLTLGGGRVSADMDKAQRVLDRLHEDLLPGMPKTQVESYLKSQEFDNIRGSAPSSISSEYCVTMVANLVEAPGELGTAEVDLEVILEMTVWTPEGEQTHAL